MTLVRMAWSWETGTPRERADTVRRHAFSGRTIPESNLLTLFNLTDVGLRRIMAGEDWRPEFDADAVPPKSPLNSIDARLRRLQGRESDD